MCCRPSWELKCEYSQSCNTTWFSGDTTLVAGSSEGVMAGMTSVLLPSDLAMTGIPILSCRHGMVSNVIQCKSAFTELAAQLVGHKWRDICTTQSASGMSHLGF